MCHSTFFNTVLFLLFNPFLFSYCSFFLLYFLELLDAVEKSYSPTPHVEVLDIMYDIRSWMAPARLEIHNISNPHSFVLEETSTGDVILRYKNWSKDKEWQPSKNPDDCIPVLKVGCSLKISSYN